VLLTIVILVFAVLLGRVFYLQAIEGDYYRGKAEGNRLRILSMTATRGLMYDRNGQILVGSRPAYTISIMPNGKPLDDDELAKDLDDEVETLDELKAKYRKELEAAKEIAYDDAVEGAALDLAVENAEIVELPAEMVEDEVHRAMNEFMGNMQRQGISPEMYFQITGTTQEDLHKQYEADADKRVKTNLVIEAVAAAEGFDATEEEIQKEINDLAAEYNMEVSQVSALLSPEMLKHDITMKKAVEVITSTAKVK